MARLSLTAYLKLHKFPELWTRPMRASSSVASVTGKFMNAPNEMQPVCSWLKGLAGLYAAGSTGEDDALGASPRDSLPAFLRLCVFASLFASTSSGRLFCLYMLG
jgi:hypothetical protein